MDSKIPETNIKICGPKRNFSEYESASVEEILDYFEDKDQVEVDTETTGFDPHSKEIITLQLGDIDRQYVIDVRTVAIKHFKDLIESKLCLLQNAKFDYKILYKNDIVLNEVYDTMLAEQIIFNGFKERGSSLKALNENYLGVEMEKETRGTFSSLRGDPLKDRQIRYAGTDVARLSMIKRLQQRYIRKYDLHNAIELAMKVIHPLADMELNGMRLDQKEWMGVANKKEQKLINLEYKMDRYLVDEGVYQPNKLGSDLFGNKTRVLDINYGSPKQVKETLISLGMDVDSTGARTLKKLKDNKFVELLLDHRELAKKVSTYGEKFLEYINRNTGRVHTSFWQIKNTYRLGSGSKKFNAPNMQNIPSDDEYRNCFKPRKGFSFAAIDYSSQELTVMADKANEKGFLDVLERGDDLHCFVYNKMTGENITKEDKEKRTKAKVINFGKPYGMSPYKLSDTLDIPIDEAEEFFELYAEAFPALDNWLEEQGEKGNDQGYILIDKRHKGRRWFPQHKKIQKEYHQMHWKERNRLQGIIERASMNTPIQGTSAIMTKDAMVNVRDFLKKNNYWQNGVFMICQIHDELVFEIKDEIIDQVLPKIEQIMKESANKYLDRIEMGLDTIISKEWKKD